MKQSISIQTNTSLFPSLRICRLQSFVVQISLIAPHSMQISASSELKIIVRQSNKFSIWSRFTLNSLFIQCYLCLDREEVVDYSPQFVVSIFVVSDFIVSVSKLAE